METQDLQLLNGYEATAFDPKAAWETVVERLQIDADASVLEVGCGAGCVRRARAGATALTAGAQLRGAAHQEPVRRRRPVGQFGEQAHRGAAQHGDCGWVRRTPCDARAN